MSAAPGAAPVAFPPRAVDVPGIERELARLWESAQSGGEGADVVTRACMSNLIIFSTREEALRIPDEIGTIIERHPSRVLLLVGDASEQPLELEASVSAQCYLGPGRRQICSEHVTLSARPAATRRLPSTARSLLIGDLPTALWWATPQPPPLGGDVFHELAGMANHVLYDSVGWTDPARGISAVAEWAENARPAPVVSDLAWRRLKPWRRLVAQALDPRVMPGALASLEEVTVEHGPHALAKAWFLIGWLACRLGWRPTGAALAPNVELEWRFETPRGPLRARARRLPSGEADVQRVSVAWRDPVSGARGASFERLGPGRLGAFFHGAREPLGVLNAPPQSRARLVANQLPDLARDALFRDVLEISRVLAEQVPG